MDDFFEEIRKWGWPDVKGKYRITTLQMIRRYNNSSEGDRNK